MIRPSLQRLLVPALATIALVVVTARAPRSSAHAATSAAHDMTGMSPSAMQRMSDAWFARHPATPSADLATAAITDSFNVVGFSFDKDGNTANIDTAHVFEGDAVAWNWVSGSHTITNGTGSTDPSVGTLFDAPSNSSATRFVFTFTTAGTYPFFCRFHELSNMKGVVVVKSLVGVTPGAPRAAGFVTDPAPVPSRGGVSFRFSLPAAGRARAEVFDVRGRRVAVAFDRVSGAGTFDGAWDGRVAGGARAASGVYYVRLSVPGAATTRRVVITD